MNLKAILTNDPTRDMIISFRTIRRAVGWLGIALPIAMFVGTWVIGGCSTLKPSISDYFYTIMGSVLVGVLCAVALFQLTYKGPAPIDGILSSTAAIFALGVAFFPCNISGGHYDCNIICRQPDELRNTVHYISAGGLFVVQAIMSAWLFRRTNKPGTMGLQKEARNKVYLICSIIMIGAMTTMFVFMVTGLTEKYYAFRPTFVLETVTLWAFGVSWLVKGEVVLKDKIVRN
jgi:hypothetical protein